MPPLLARAVNTVAAAASTTRVAQSTAAMAATLPGAYVVAGAGSPGSAMLLLTAHASAASTSPRTPVTSTPTLAALAIVIMYSSRCAAALHPNSASHTCPRTLMSCG